MNKIQQEAFKQAKTRGGERAHVERKPPESLTEIRRQLGWDLVEIRRTGKLVSSR